MTPKEANRKGFNCLRTLETGVWRKARSSSRRSSRITKPRNTVSVRTWTVSMMGSAQVDSRMTVPNDVSCSHTRALSSIIGGTAWAPSFRLAWRGIPLGRVGLLELRAGDEVLIQVFRIGDDTGHHQPDIPVGFLEAVEILLDRGIGPVRY